MKMLIQHNVLDIFSYNVADDELFIRRNNLEQGLTEITKKDYLSKCGAWSLSEESHDRFVAMIRRLMVNQEENEGQYALDREDVRQRILCRYKAIRDKDGHLSYVVGQMEDLNFVYDTMHKTIVQQNDYIKLIQTLTMSFETVLYADLSNFTYQVLRASEAAASVAELSPSLRDFARLLVSSVVKPNYRDRLEQFVNLYTLPGRLVGQQFLSMDFETENLGWTRVRIVPAQSDKEGRITHVIVTTECSDPYGTGAVYQRQISDIDGLTGLLTRQAGEALINQRLRDENLYAFCIFDCDNFKQVNDTMGHMVGDKLISRLGQALLEAFPDQVCMRLGGDEFVVFLTGEEVRRSIASVTGGTELLRGFKERIAAIQIPEMLGSFVTMSGGVAISDGSSIYTFDTLYAMADKALYQSKRIRNGQITFAKTSRYR